MSNAKFQQAHGFVINGTTFSRNPFCRIIENIKKPICQFDTLMFLVTLYTFPSCRVFLDEKPVSPSLFGHGQSEVRICEMLKLVSKMPMPRFEFSREMSKLNVRLFFQDMNAFWLTLVSR